MTGSDGYRVGVFGALTLHGKELVGILRDRIFPVASLALLTDDEEEAGTLAEGVLEPAFLRMASREVLEGLDMIFFCGDPETAARWIPLRDELSFTAIDLTQPSAFSNEVEARVAGIGSGELPTGDLVVSAHPVAAMICLILEPLLRHSTIEFFTASVILPASELGQEGIDELFQQTLAVLNAEGPPRQVFEQQAAFNIYTPRDAFELEDYIVGQIRQIIGSELRGSVLVQQGSTFHSHSLALHVRLARAVDPAEIQEALEGSVSLVAADPDTLPGLTDAGGLDAVLIVRVGLDREDARSLWIQAASDNLRRSSVLNAVMLVEELVGRTTSGPN